MALIPPLVEDGGEPFAEPVEARRVDGAGLLLELRINNYSLESPLRLTSV